MYVCKELILVDGIQQCAEWAAYVSFADSVAITRDHAYMLLTPIASIYGLLIAWSFIQLIRRHP